MRHFELHIIIFILLTSCTTNENNPIQKETETLQEKESIQKTTPGLLTSALKVDSLEYQDIEPFIYFKAGNILTSKEKHAIAIQSPADSTFTIDLYKSTDGQWKLLDHLDTLEAIHIQFHPTFADYNFDNIKDLYIQLTASNGYVMSRGHLITIDNEKLIPHPEVREAANLTPDKVNKFLIADELIECKNTLGLEPCKRTYVWMEGHLEKRERKMPL